MARDAEAAHALQHAARAAVERSQELTARSAELVEQARRLRTRVDDLKRRRRATRENANELRDGPSERRSDEMRPDGPRGRAERRRHVEMTLGLPRVVGRGRGRYEAGVRLA